MITDHRAKVSRIENGFLVELEGNQVRGDKVSYYRKEIFCKNLEKVSEVLESFMPSVEVENE
jgi:hypothetical protein